MITIHHLNNSRSQRILWLLEELSLPYEIKFYERDPKTMLAPPELKKIHPLGKSPVLTDGDTTIAESGAIIEYLLKKYDQGKLRPALKTNEDTIFTYWLHYAEGSAMPPLLLNLIFNRIPKQPMPFFIRPIINGFSKKVLATFVDPQLKTHIDYIENHLQKNTWFVGNDFTAADIQMSFPLEAANARMDLKKDYPKILDFLKRIHAMKTYQAALEKGGPYDLLS